VTQFHVLMQVSRLMRRTVMRYVVLCYTLTMIAVAPSAKKRFPTSQHLVNAGQLLPLLFPTPRIVAC